MSQDWERGFWAGVIAMALGAVTAALVFLHLRPKPAPAPAPESAEQAMEQVKLPHPIGFASTGQPAVAPPEIPAGPPSPEIK
ncbi:MAG: hypothetical protein PHE83_09455 [Opitutaceae bacterium]|nr:hypothetical protein [Opitutaceae bacterium]